MDGFAIPLGAYYSISDPWVGIAPNGNIYVIAILVDSSYSGGTTTGSQAAANALSGTSVCCYTSSDGGQTWSFVVIPGSDGGNPDNTFGAVDLTSGNVYAIWNSDDVYSTGGTAGAYGALAFAYSTDGSTWKRSNSALPNGNSSYDLTSSGFNFVNISVAPDDGSIHIIGTNGPTMSYARSTDKGQSFSVGVIAAQQVGIGDIANVTTPIMLAPVNPPAICAAGNGLVVAAWSVDTGQSAAIPGPQMRVAVSTCTDGGARWAATTSANAPSVAPLLPLGNLSQTPQDQYFLPRLAAMPNGTVGCTFLYCYVSNPGASAINAALLSTGLAVSLPNAAYPTYFDPNSTTAVLASDIATSPVSSNPVLRWGQADDNFIGDFIGLVGLGSGFGAYWSDTRSSSAGGGTAQILYSYLAVQTPACSLIIDRGSYGEDAVTASLAGGTSTSYSDAIFVVVDGLSPAQLNLATLPQLRLPPPAALPGLTGSVFNNAGVTTTFDSNTGIQLENPSNFSAVQRMTFPFNIVFSIPAGAQTLQAFNDLNQSGANERTYQLLATATSVATGAAPALTLKSSPADIVFVTQFNPYMEAGETWWLSNDMRVFTVTPAALSSGQSPLPYSSIAYGSDPNVYISALIDELNLSFTDPSNVSTPFNAISTSEDESALMLGQTDASGNDVYNFALARVRLQGDAAANVRMFFRLFISSSPDTDFDPTTTFASLPQTDASGKNIADTLIPVLGVPTTDMPSTLPFFARARIDSTQQVMTLQSDPKNVQNIAQPLAGNEVYAYFGCYLDINQPTLRFPLNPAGTSSPNGPWPATGTGVAQPLSIPAIIMGSHACLVAEISYDPEPIPAGVNAATSDKIGQRNLAWSGSDNPGPAAAHRVSTLFDIRPTVPSVPTNAPDELMIEWGNTPAGSRASIYWPAIDADQVLQLANRYYGTRRLSKADSHTIQCLTSDVTYIPIPPGTGPKLAGLLTIQLPQTVRVGQEFNVIVRRLSTRSVGNPHAVRDLRKWRYVVGAFQVRIPVSTGRALLPLEEDILAVYKWKIEQIPTTNRWHPVLHRYIADVSGRVNGFGGNASGVQASSAGGGSSSPVLHHGRHEYTGKVTGLVYDRFGDFEGFLLLTDDGVEMTFFAHERPLEQRVREAWLDRMVISVFVDQPHLRRPVGVILRRGPRRGDSCCD